jgi:hypothetical protein
MAGQNRRQLPGQIDCVADPGVHPLSAGRAVDVSRVAKQEGAALPEMLRHPVMDMIGRKPVHFPDINLKMLDRPTADIIECERVGVVRTLVGHGADQARSPVPG